MDFNPIDNLKYSFGYNAGENTIDFRFSFTHKCPDNNGTIVDMNPHGGGVRYSRKQKGRKPHVFDDPKAMSQVALDAERLFSQELGGAIDVAIQMLGQDVAQRVGLVLVKSGDWGKKLAKAYKNERSERLKIKPGPEKGSTWPQSKHPKFARENFNAELTKAIRAHYDQDATRKSVATMMGYLSVDTFDRDRERLDDDKSPWRRRVKAVSRK